MSNPLTVEELIELGVEAAEAEVLAQRLRHALACEPVSAWRQISQSLLKPTHPFDLHRRLFGLAMAGWDEKLGPRPAWTPTAEEIAGSNIGRLMREHGHESVAQLHSWSVRERDAFWGEMIDRLGIRLSQPCEKLVDLSEGVERPRWLCGARLNIAESCFGAPPDKVAIRYHDEAGTVRQVTYAKLRTITSRVANGLRRCGFMPGDAIAIYLPMNVESVAIYLGIIRAGCVAVSIADSLAADEIMVRMRLGNARAVFTQDVLLRGGKRLPLFAKIVEAVGPRAIVVISSEPDANDATLLRAGDLTWDEFLHDGTLSPTDQFEPHLADPAEPTNILFSSGTTGEPKAIPWTHVTPIKCAGDALLHQDAQAADCVAWPTNLGWMMGPWLIYASLVNRATMALYGGAPTGRDFGQFVQDARVTVLGVIPSLVKTWRASGCMHGLDWSSIRCFSSTGECSNPDDMLYLMSLAGYRPVIEYCGGTELGGGYIGATMAQANALSTFSTPSFGTELVFKDAPVSGATNEADGCDSTSEVFLVPPAIGMSTRLLHHDHHAVYYAGTPTGPRGEVLRRHGDALERLPGGYFRAAGRVDDTMNLGGIKVSSVEIERVLNTVAGVRETAAIGVTPRGGGPSLLWVFAVLGTESTADLDTLRTAMQSAIRHHLNPLFKIERVVTIDALPRTASHKIMRRVLRASAEG